MSNTSTIQRRPAYSHTFANGMVVIGESTESVQSAALTLMTPCGYSCDPAHQLGLSSLLCDMVLRGAGSRDSRALVNDLENLGVESGESVGSSQTSFSAATLSTNLEPALEIYADIVRRPHLPEDKIVASQQVCLQEIHSAEDEPSQQLMMALRRRSYPEPWGRSSHGTVEGVEGCDYEAVKQHFEQSYRPNGTILGVAGRFDWDELVKQVEALFGDWPAVKNAGPQATAIDPPPLHVEHDSNQCHIGIAYPTVPYRDEQYLPAWAAVGVLSSGMSSRLFTEVREKRGLCYTVSASLQTQLDRARVFCYAGTTAERAQETLDVTYGELVRLREGVEPGELARLKARIKSSLIMQQESTSARSGAIAREWYHLGRIRPLEEVSEMVDQLTSDDINAHLSKNPPADFTFATLGPAELEIPA